MKDKLRIKDRFTPKTSKKTTKKRYRNNQGIITVFVTLIMVPVVVITSIMVDVSRLKLYSSQAVMAADSYGEAVLSEYDNLLKELYGLFSVTQNSEGLEAVKKLAEYTQLSFNPNGDDKDLTGFMPYANADVQIDYVAVEGASLSNNNVLMTQINDFMKYRIVEEILESAGILNSLEQFDHMDSDMDAVDARNDITNSSVKALGKIEEYYQELKKIAQYPDYLEERQKAFEDYSSVLKSIVNPAPGAGTDAYDDYVKYVNYLENQEEIDAAKLALEEYEERQANKEEEDEEGEEGEDDGDEESDDDEDEMDEETLDKLRELADQYVDVDAYKSDLEDMIGGYERAANNNSSDPIDFDSADEVIKRLRTITNDLDNVLSEISEQVNELKSQLTTCSEEVRTGIEKEIADLNEIVEMAKEFRHACELVEQNIFEGGSNNRDNKDLMEEQTKILNKVKDDIFAGDAEPGKSDWEELEFAFEWEDFRDDRDANELYNFLQELCESGENGKENGDKEIERANEQQKAAEESLNKDEETSARDISSELAAQLQTSGTTTDEVPSLTDYFSDSLSFEAVAAAGNSVISKFMLATYDFGMFSSRVSGQAPEGEERGGSGGGDEVSGSGGSEDDGNTGGGEGGDSSGESGSEGYVDYSLTDVPMSKDINYLYGAEVEYLFGGHNRSKDNLNEVRNIICGVRLTMNFVSSYTIKEVNEAISGIADGVAAATGPAAPLVRVAVSGALRLAFSTIETVADWNALTSREGVVFLKQDFGDLESFDLENGNSLTSLLSGLRDSGERKGPSDKGFELTYEDYLYILLVLFVDENTLLSRTSNLITLNVNEAVNSPDTLTTLDFKMANTVTAVRSTCKVKMDFVVLPDNFARMFLSGSSAEVVIENLEDEYFGYSIIRGY